MSEYKPPNNKRPGYNGVPLRKKGAPKPPVKKNTPKYGGMKKPSLPKAVIVTNILMVFVILSICGLVFAIVYNNIQYDEADAARNSSTQSSAVQSSEQSGESTAPQSTETSGQATQSEPTSEDTSEPESTPESSGETSTPAVTPSGSFDLEFFENDLFIGDSIFTGLYKYEGYLKQKNVAAALGYTPYSAQTTAFDEEFYSGSAVDYAKSLQPKHIIIMLGTNGLGATTDLDDFENGYRGLLNTLKSDCPDSTIVAVSVPPITANSSGASYSGITNTIINSANSTIKSLCGELNVLYYDLNSVLKDENGYFSEEYAEVDGMHFLGTTYGVLLSGVEEFLKQQ